jgi:glycosyltransferase involved in cell wall biosynthesis
MDRASTIGDERRVLLISSVFPPEYSSGAFRPLQMGKYLPDFGWTPLVLTSALPAATVDDDGHVPPTLILRAPRRHPAETYIRLRSAIGLPRIPGSGSQSAAVAAVPGAGRRRIADYLLFPDDRICWVPGAIWLGAEAVRRHKPSVLYSTSPDPSVHLVALALARLMRLPWVAEFRDPWTMNPFREPRPFAWMERAEHWLERRVVTTADHIVVTSAEYAADFCKSYPELDLGKFSHLPNGFDPEDFEGVQAERFDKFTIVHAGNFYEKRTARPFLLGLRRWLERDRQALASTQVLFVGRKDPDSTAAIRELGLQDTVTQTGVLPHRRTVASMLGADLLLLVPGPGEGTMPGKIFEYLAARKPVLTIADEGVARELVCRAGIGSAIYLSDVEGLAAELARLRQAIIAHLFPYPDTTELLRQYDSRCIAGRLASVLDRVVGRQ